MDALTDAPALAAHREGLAGDLCIRLCAAEESRRLNHAYRGFDKPTNVLSFPAEVAVADVSLLGDLLICLPVVQAEAEQQGKPVADHLHHLVVHGVLHLLGFDHQTPDTARVMEQIERDLLAAFNIPDPY